MAKRNPTAVSFSSVPMGEHHIGGYAFTFQPSRLPSKVRVVPLDSEGGYKGRSTYLLEKFSPAYSHRAGYTLSPSAALKLLAAMQAGGEYVSPKEAREKKAKAVVEKDVAAFVCAKGGSFDKGSSSYPLSIETPLGLLRVSSNGPGTVFTRFEDSSRAEALAGRTGKWNFHGKDAVGEFKRALTHLLAKANPKGSRKNPEQKHAMLGLSKEAVTATIKHLKMLQEARAKGYKGRYTEDPAWLVQQAINRRGGYVDDPHYRGSALPVNGKFPKKGGGDWERHAMQIAQRVNTPRLRVYTSELGEWGPELKKRLPHRFSKHGEEDNPSDRTLIKPLLGWAGYTVFGKKVYRSPKHTSVSVQQKPSGWILFVGGDHFGPYTSARKAIECFEAGMFMPGTGGAVGNPKKVTLNCNRQRSLRA